MEIDVTLKFRDNVTDGLCMLKTIGTELCRLPSADELDKMTARLNQYHPQEVIKEILKSDHYRNNKDIYYTALDFVLKSEVCNYPTQGFAKIGGKRYDYLELAATKLQLKEDDYSCSMMEKIVDFAGLLEGLINGIKTDLQSIFGVEGIEQDSDYPIIITQLFSSPDKCKEFFADGNGLSCADWARRLYEYDKNGYFYFTQKGDYKTIYDEIKRKHPKIASINNFHETLRNLKNK